MKSTWMLTLSLALLCPVCQAVAADPTPAQMGEVYGYYMSQMITMELIAESYPRHAVRARAAREQYRTYFAPYIAKIDSIANSHGRAQWARLKQQMESEARRDLQEVPLTPDKQANALTYVRQVEQEARGRLPSDILRILSQILPREPPVEQSDQQSLPMTKYTSTQVSFPGCEFAVSFPCRIKESKISRQGVRRTRYESVYQQGVPYLRADAVELHASQRSELIKSLETHLQSTAARLGLPDPETRVERTSLGVIGSFLAIKKAGGHPIQFHCKWVIGESSLLNLLVSEPVGTYPSDRTLLFLNSVVPRATAKTLK